MAVQFDLFEHLIKSPSKDFLNQILLESFNQTEETKTSSGFLNQLSQLLEIDQSTSEKLIIELGKFIRKLLFESCTDVQQIQNEMASSNLQPNLKNLLSKLLAERLVQFKNKLINEEGMMPKLLDFDWRVDIKMDSNLSDSGSKSGQQTCILNLKTDEEHARTNLINKQPIMDIGDIIKQQFKKRSQKQLGLLSFLARLYPNDKCGSNGLPLTPNSIRVYGKFQYLKTLNNPNLCKYVDIQRSQSERLFILSEHYSLNLQDLLNDTYIYNLIITNTDLILNWIEQLFNSFLYINDHDITNRLLSLKNILITPQGNVKLGNYGIFYMSENGHCVDFLIANIETLAPECFLLDFINSSKNFEQPTSNSELLNKDLSNPKSDVWSFGCILVQFFFGLKNLRLSPQTVLEKSLNSSKFESGYEFLLDLYSVDSVKKLLIEQKLRPVFLKLIKQCLILDASQRPDFRELYKLFKEYLNDEKLDVELNKNSIINEKLNLFNNTIRFNEYERENDDEDFLWRRGVNEVYFLWKLAAGDCLQTLKLNGRLKTTLSSIHKFSIYTQVENGYEHGKLVHEEELKFNDEIVSVSLDQLRNRLSSMTKKALYPLFEFTDDQVAIENIQSQPVNIRELDIEYQFSRMILFSRFLTSYPFKRDELIKECKIDIPPLYRNLAWAALLDVPANIKDIYSSINKEQITSTDRQIDVDIPRCHQYDPLMATPQGHIKLKRILKSWVLYNPNLVYWQGLDSLCAPFLYLNFNREELAFGCLNNFVNKYAANFFLKDNSAVIHEYLAVFSHLISFNEPELAAHFESIDFRPDLYAIPWFLTMFAHVFPLYKIFHLWDCLLNGSSGYPLCIGVAILKQLKNILLQSDFNECILFFSELPEINIEKCVKDSMIIFKNSPESCMYREHSGAESKNIDDSYLDITPISLDKMRSELCPRISARDVLEFYGKNKKKFLILDIRSINEFASGYLSESKNFPYDQLNFTKLSAQTNNSNENDLTLNLSYVLNQHKNSIKIIVSSDEMFDSAIDLANRLIQDAEKFVNQAPQIEHINLELTKQTLNTMIDGLTKIKEQLNSIAANQ